MTKKLKPWTRDTPPNYVGDIEWIMQSPKSGLYVHVYIDEDKDDPARQAMQEISEALNELWEQQRVEIKHDPMDIEHLAQAANEQLKKIISQDVVEQLRAENKRLRQEVQHAHDWETAADKRARELEARLADQEPRTEMRVIELIEYRLDLDEPYIEYQIQYRNDRGPWITLPVTRTQDRERYERMKGGSDG